MQEKCLLQSGFIMCITFLIISIPKIFSQLQAITTGQTDKITELHGENPGDHCDVIINPDYNLL